MFQIYGVIVKRTLSILFILPILFLGLASCAPDRLDISIQLQYDAGLQALVNSANSSNTPLGLRLVYTYGSANNKSVVQPISAQPDGSPNNPSWETAQSQGFNLDGDNFYLRGVPFGFRDVEVIVEILQQGRLNLWYVIGYYCWRPAPGEILTPQILKSFNNQPMTLTKGRACGRCADEDSFTVAPDSADDVCNDGI